MNRRLLVVAFTAGCALVSLAAWRIASTPAQPPAAPAAKANRTSASPLPISQVVLFSSGVGYFQREGEVEDTARVDLSFPVSDVNDLLKSLVLQDLGGGKISTIGYDSPDPLDKTLHSFAIDLSTNPTFGEILNQARGQKIEVALQQSAGAQSAPVTGVIVGMEAQMSAASKEEVHSLNLMCAEGMRTVPLTQVQRVRFLDPVVDGDFRRALEVLSNAHDMQKKSITLHFTGDGKRPVRVGYVIEHPIWKTSYRLVLGKDNKIHLQGWANVENTTDEDWKDVRMALVSGRPISFQTDLYTPLFIPRPNVEMERFASLKPPVYNAALARATMMGLGALGGGLGALGGGIGGAFSRAQLPKAPGQQEPDDELGPPRNGFISLNRYQLGRLNDGEPINGRLSYEELQRRQQEAKDNARKVGSAVARLDPTEGVASAASVEEFGDYFQYKIDEKVTLSRQKSAMLPILNLDIEGTRVSIFNESVHVKFPLLGLRFKNTTGQPLTQGPITVFESGGYAGDSRIMDLQPGEERLLSYAIDLGTEVKGEHSSRPEQLIAAKIVRGHLVSHLKSREIETYFVKNRSSQDRTLLIEHPIRAAWKLTVPEKPHETSRDFYRFKLAVAAGQETKLEVVEENTQTTNAYISSFDDDRVRFYLGQAVVSDAVKNALEKHLSLRRRVIDAQRDFADENAKLKALNDDQARLRANLKEMPPTAAAYKRYLDKFDKQEVEMESLQERIKELTQEAKKRFKENEDYVSDLSVD